MFYPATKTFPVKQSKYLCVKYKKNELGSQFNQLFDHSGE